MSSTSKRVPSYMKCSPVTGKWPRMCSMKPPTVSNLPCDLRPCRPTLSSNSSMGIMPSTSHEPSSRRTVSRVGASQRGVEQGLCGDDADELVDGASADGEMLKSGFGDLALYDLRVGVRIEPHHLAARRHDHPHRAVGAAEWY